MNTLQQGTTLQGGKYIIMGTLGQGGFGITYLAEQTRTGRKVAIKEFFMKERCERDASTNHVTVGTEAGRAEVNKYREKFIKEAGKIAKLKHPNIVKVHDVFEENNTAYYVMDYASGGSLADLVKRKGCLWEHEATRYILQVADALQYIHAQNMAHLDVKPANIMLNDCDEAILIDFGLSKQYDATSGGQTSTTPVGISEGYAPMEQYRQGGVSEFSPETDIYSLGATFFKLLTGKTPPTASDIFEDGIPVQELKSRGVSQVAISVIIQAMEPIRKNRMKDVHLFISTLNGTEPSPCPASCSVDATVTSSVVDDEATKVVGVKNAAGANVRRNTSRRSAVENSSLSDNKRLLVGKWRAQNKTDDGVFVVTAEYYEDGTFSSVLRYYLDTTDENMDAADIQETVIVAMLQKGTWHIQEGYLYEKSVSVGLDKLDVKLEGEGLTDDKLKLAEYIEARKKDIYSECYEPMKNELLGDDSEPDKIVSIDRRRLILEDSDGRTEYKRVLNNDDVRMESVSPKKTCEEKSI